MDYLVPIWLRHDVLLHRVERLNPSDSQRSRDAGFPAGRHDAQHGPRPVHHEMGKPAFSLDLPGLPAPALHDLTCAASASSAMSETDAALVPPRSMIMPMRRMSGICAAIPGWAF